MRSTSTVARLRVIFCIGLVLTFIPPTSLPWAQTPPQSTPSQPGSSAKWTPLSVTLPASASMFTGGDAAAVANAQCLICHSVEMILTQPKMTGEQWKAEIEKMRTAYGAPMPADQVDRLAAYLANLSPEK